MFAAPVPPSTPLDSDATNTPPPASGPFMIVLVDAPRTLTLERNPQFQTVKDAGADEVPDASVDKITLTENKNNSAQVTDIEQNKVDFMIDPPASDRGEVKAQYGDRFRLEESINTYYYWMNTQKPPFNDLKVRQAINYAIDPEALNRIFGCLHPTQQILPPGMPGYQEYKLYPGPDLDRAKQLIAEANPADRDITVWTDDEPDRKRIGEYYHDLLTQLGFNATLKVIAGDVYWTTIGNESTPDLDTGFADWFQDFPHPDDFFRPLLHGDSILPTNSNNFPGQHPGQQRQGRRAAAKATRRRRRRGAVRSTRPTWSRPSGRPTATSSSRRSCPSAWTSTSPTTTCCSTRTTRPSPSSSHGRAQPRSANWRPCHPAASDRRTGRADPGPQPLCGCGFGCAQRRPPAWGWSRHDCPRGGAAVGRTRAHTGPTTTTSPTR